MAAVMTTPVLQALHRRHPRASIDIVTDARAAALFSHCPWRRAIILKDKGAGWGGLVALLRRLRASRYDLARFGMERQAFSPRQSDLLICAGRLPFKLAPVIRKIWDQMLQPKWCISMGACASTGGIFDNYAMVQGIDTIVPVDVYVPGCPPRPEGLLHAILMIQKKIKGETVFDPALRVERLVGEDGLFLPPAVVDELSEPFGNSVAQTRSA